MDIYGLIGKPLTHSFSQNYFSEKFIKEQIIDVKYELFELENIHDLPELIHRNPQLKGFNVTIPYKQVIIPLLDEITEPAKSIGAVNTVKLIKTVNDKYKLIGYNTDVIGFEKSLLLLIAGCNVKKAIIIGTGGSAKAVAYVLKRNNIEFLFISRDPKNNNEVLAENISQETMNEVSLIINCSPVGMFPEINAVPPFNYSLICSHHILYDLVYNPEFTAFMKEGLKRGTKVKNGLEMLMLQAKESWKIWRD